MRKIQLTPAKYPSIKHYLKAFIDPDFDLEQDLPFRTVVQTIPANTVITHIGDVENFAHYIISGYARVSAFDRNAEEKVLEFFGPDDFISAYTSFVYRTPSKVFVKTISECTFETIHVDDINTAIRQNLNIALLTLNAVHKNYAAKTQIQLDFLLLDNDELVAKILHEREELLNITSAKLIASYLDMTEVTFSRIRKDLRDNLDNL
ncbi:MAG: Crp/Fnr family transcriptional regulator [Chitinophagaceae bacterium]|nr:Crp/Fnr family transcriptional regulator [Chitinophagaceae bacterium]